MSSEENELDLPQALALAVRAQQNGQTDEAGEIYRRILEVWPACPDALHFSGLLAFKKGDIAKAVALVEKSVALAPGHAGFWNNFGNLFKEQGEKIKAAAAYRQAVDLQPDFADAHNNLGVMASQNGDFTAAVEAYGKAIAIAPDHADAHFNLGIARENLDQFDDAATAYRTAIRLRPGNAIAYGQLGYILWRQGRKEESVEAIVAATDLNPGDAKAFLFLGGLFYEQNRVEESVEAYRKAVEIEPTNTSFNRILGLTLAQLGRPEEAKTVWQKWIEADPENPVPRHLLQAGTDEQIPERADNAFVVHEFDGFAEHFDKQLQHLQYRAPELVAEALRQRVGATAALDILDAGCGTGLCAPLLRPLARHLEGVDLSPGMLEKARERGGYDALTTAELTAFIAGRKDSYDVIVSADTLCYFGRLEAVFDAAYGALRPAGHLIFTVEKTPSSEDKTKVTLDPSGRYTHTEAYIRTALEEASFIVDEITSTSLRMEYFKPVEGLIVVAQRAASFS